MHEIRPGWRSIPLHDTGTWLSGGTPSTDEERFWHGDIPWISAASLKNFRISHSDRRVTQLGALAGTRLVPQGTVLFVVRGMSLKTEFRVGITERKVAFGQDCKAILPAPGIDGNFLALAMKASSQQILAMVDEAGHGTGRLPTDLISKLEIGIPEFREQQRIAEILDASDHEISSTQKVIAKLRWVNSGLLSNLLARVDAPVRPLGDFLVAKPHNGFSPNETEDWTGVVALGLGCLTAEGFVPRQLKNVPARDSRYAGAWLSDGDLLISRSNTYDLVGLVGRYRDVDIPCIYPDLMMKLTPNALVRPGFLELVLRNTDAREQIKRISQGTSGSMVKISGASLVRIQVKIPDLTEQDRVLSIFAAQTAQLDALEREKTKLRMVKKGLMEDLLTGRVRVRDL